MKIIYVPKWVSRAFKDANESIKGVLDLSKLMSILSKDDVAFYIYLNLILNEFIPRPVLLTIRGRLSMEEQVICSSGEIDPETFRKSDKLQIWDKLAEYMANGPGAVPMPATTNLTVDLLDENTLMFSPLREIEEGDVSGGDVIGVSLLDVKIKLYDRLIQQLSPFVAFPDLMMTPLMNDYLISVRLQRGSVAPALKAA